MPLSPFLDKLSSRQVSILACLSLTVTLNPDRDEHRPCKIKGSSYVKTQVDVEAFQHNNLDGVASRVQRGSIYSKVRQRLNEVQKELQEDGLMLVV